MGIVEALVGALVPILVQEAEALLGSKPDPSDHSWVVGLVQDVVNLLDKVLPAWVKPAEGAVEQLVVEAVQKLLAKV